MKKQLQKLSSILLCFVMLIGLLPTTVFATSTQAAEKSYALNITNKPGTTFVLEHDSTSDVCDLWNEIDSDGTGELKFDQSFSININDAIDVYNNYLDTKYPNGEYDDHKASEDIHNGSTFYVEARIWINNDNDFRFINKAGYMLAPYGLDGEKNDGCGEWYLSSSDDLSEEFFTMSIDSTGKTLNFALDGTVKEIYEALKTENEALGDVTIDSLMFDVWVSCEVEYYNSWGDISYTEQHFESISHTLYDKHIYESESEYDVLSAISTIAPLTVNVGPAYEGCYEPVETEYNWYYKFIKEGADEVDGEWYGYFEIDETKESDVLTETGPSGTVFGVAYGALNTGDKNYIKLNDILNENNKDFINSFIGAKPRELGGIGEMFIGCTVTLTFADGKQYVVDITKAHYMSKLVAPCMHACTVCGYCTVTDEMLPCNFDQMSYEISNVCICDEPSVPEFEVTRESESEAVVESTETTVKVVVEKIEVEETPTHSFIVNATNAVGADNVIALYNINVFDEYGYPYTLNQWGDMGEELTVSVPVSMEEALALQNGEAALYHILADGTAEEVEGVTVAIEGESATMTFTSDSFSPYIVARTATATTYTVSFDANGGTGTMADVTGVSGEYTLPANGFTAPSGKQFKAWSVGGSEKAVGDKITVTADTTATAVWETVSEYTKVGDISAVTATADITPVLDATTSAPGFTITSPEEQGVRIVNQFWYKKNASNEWVGVGSTEKFEEGIYRLQVQLRTDKNADKEYYAMSGDTTFTVNGDLWSSEEPFRDYYATNGYGYRVFVSPEFTLGGKTLDSIAVTTPPTKTAYREGEDFNPAGMVVTATYTDSTAAPVVLYTVTDGTALTAGKTSVTISYTEGGVTKTTTQAITVAKEYTVTVEGGTGNGKYIAGETVTVSAFVASGQKFKEWLGADSLTFTGGTGKTSAIATFTMPAQDVTVKAVTEADEYPVSVGHGSGDGNYAMGDIVTITADAPPSGMYFAGWEVSDGLTLRYAEDTDSRSSTAKFYMPPNAVNISAVYNLLTLVRIDIVASPTKTAYTVGESFDPAGMVVMATYSDRSTAPVTGYTVNPADALSESDTEITVTYTEDGVITTAVQAIRVTAAAYTVSYDANGGTGTMADVTGISGEYTLPENGFTAPDGKQFKAWSVGGSEKAVGDKITVTANTTVTAVWENIPVVTYTVTFNANGGSVTPASAETGADGKLASLPTPTRSGSYSFKGWYTATSGGTKVTSSTVFNANTTIYAQWTYTGGGGGGYYPTTYAITVEDAKNGDVTVSHKSTYKGATVTVTVEPDKGYTLETLTVTDKNGKEIELTNKSDGKYTFKMPASKITVTATFMDDNTMLNFFVDVPTDAYYYDAVLWAAKTGITSGTTATTFSPDNPCTRAQMATFLWRAAGSPEPVGRDFPFVDVAADTYYAKAVQWAYEQGITGGTSATTFSPDETCTRGQMATFLSRMADGKPVSDKVIFADIKTDAYYAKAVQWAYEQKITAGTSATTFSPDGPCTRAQMVTFLYRFFVK